MNYALQIRTLSLSLILSCGALSVFGSDYILSQLSQVTRGRVIKTHDCYLIPQENGPTLTESPGTFNVHKGRNYSFRFSFSLYTSGTEAPPDAIEALLRKGWKVNVPASVKNTYQVLSSRQNTDHVAFSVQILAEPFYGDAIKIELRDEKGQLYGTADYNFKVLDPNPDNNVTTAMRRFDPIIQILNARRTDNPSPMVELERNKPCTLDVNLARAFVMNLQIKRENFHNGKMYTFYVNPKNDYGYRVQYRWVGRYPPGVLPKLQSDNLRLTMRSAKEAPASPRRRIDRGRFNMDERKVSGPRKYYKLEVSLSRLPDLSEKMQYYLTVGVIE